MKYFPKIYIGTGIEKFISILILFLPLALISGPALPNVFRFLIISFSIFIIFKNRKEFFFKKWYTYVFAIFCIYITLRSFFMFTEKDSSISEILFSLKSSFFYFTYFFYSLGIAYLLNKFKNIRLYLTIIIFLVIIFLCIDSLFQYTFGHNIFGMLILQPNRASSLFGDELILGSFVQKIMPIAIIMSFFYFDKKIFYKIYPFAVLLGTLTILLSGERASMLLWIGFVVLFSFFQDNKIRYKFLTIVSMFLVLFSTIIFSPKAKDRFIDESKYLFTFEESQEIKIFSIGHANHISSAMKMFKDNILFGQGPNMFRKKCSNSKFLVKHGCTAHPHNIYFQLLSETGIIGFILVFVIFLYLSFLNIKYILYKLFYPKCFFTKPFVKLLTMLIPIYFMLWPFITTGNFFNSWVNNIHFLTLGIAISYIPKFNK